MKNVIVGTAGHIDHGKSALVEALTGTHPDRLEEEKRRGITIDLGFAFLKDGEISLGFIDVPGHERFVRNMLSGVGGIDLLLFVIAADEGIKPQTREHFDICRFLGIPRGVVAITKSDLVDADTLSARKAEIQKFLQGSFLEHAPLIPVSPRTGAGIDDLKRALNQIASEVPARTAGQHFRLPIDRVFAMKGFGTVVTGTLVSGSAKIGDEVEALPSARRLRVRGIQSGGQSVSLATAGQRTALNLAGSSVEELHRGMVLTSPGLFSATTRIDSQIELLRSHPRPLKQRSQVHFHQGTSETIGEVILLDRRQLSPGDTAFAQIELSDEIFLLPRDRFIIRQFSPVVTIGGGIVLDAQPRRHKSNDPRALDFLRTLSRNNPNEVLAALLASAPDALDAKSVMRRTGWPLSQVESAATSLESGGIVTVLKRDPKEFLLTESLAACQRALAENVAKSHGQNPLAEGIPLEALRASAGAGPEAFRAALERAIAEGKLALSNDLVKVAGREVALLPAEAQARDRIAAAFEKAGLSVPAANEVLAGTSLDPARSHKLLQILLREGILVKIGDGLIFHRNALVRVRELLAQRKRTRGPRMKVPEFKEMTGVSRKYAIPLLEYLDRSGVTQRVGDERVIL
ncbi:MAG TPA: selenocysteine-specific translation elongation factor [Candidatus Acidoferrales bacterium]|nr:selenocysteine-specific translation elongation factor [Candidatus Acidoferrales bacterium]